MSFILDALKKSEERRRLHVEASQPRQKILDLSWSVARRRPAWLLSLVLLVALACGWWLRGASLQTGAESQPTAAVAPLPPRQAFAPNSVVAGTRSETPSPRGIVRPAPFAPVPAAAVADPASPARDSSRTEMDKAVSPEIRPQAKAPASFSPAVGPRPVASEIPVALRGHMSKLTISLHFFTEEPARRMVRIDDRIMREGQAVAENLLLEEITPGGAVFSFAGERFEVRGPGGQP